MKKKYALIILLAIVFIGSFVNFYTANLWLSDVSNYFADGGILISLPGVMFSLYFILGALYIIRVYVKSEYKKRITNLYTIIAAAFGLVGFVSAILAGALIYKSFTKPYPFPGYLILGIIINFIAMITAIVLNILAKRKMADDLEKRKITFKYVIYTIIVSLLIYVSFNRFGALLWAPSYIEWSTVYMTWPFYTSMLLPLAMLTTVVTDMFGFHRRNKLISIVYATIITSLNLIFAAVVIIIGSADSRFISIISPVLALERLTAIPFEIILQYSSMTIFGIYLSIVRYLAYEKSKQNICTQEPDSQVEEEKAEGYEQ